ncbi:MAG: flagellar motor stator protein MotA [Roseinatronobacter sp.]
MLVLIGILVVFGMVFGGYLGSGGTLGIILKALPFEMVMIGGAAIGAFIIANDKATLGHIVADIKRIFQGERWQKDDYRMLLILIYQLLLLSRTDPVALEDHLEKPHESDIFSKAPRIQKDDELVALICDTLRAASLNFDDPNQLEELLEKKISSSEQAALHSSHAIQIVADGLPALGIVAAVLGIIKTMGAIDQPPNVLGKMIGGALTGTFLGVFLAYGFVGPFATKMRNISEKDLFLNKVARDALVAHFQKHQAEICVEIARQNIPAEFRSTFSEVEEQMKLIRKSG